MSYLKKFRNLNVSNELLKPLRGGYKQFPDDSRFNSFYSKTKLDEIKRAYGENSAAYEFLSSVTKLDFKVVGDFQEYKDFRKLEDSKLPDVKTVDNINVYAIIKLKDEIIYTNGNYLYRIVNNELEHVVMRGYSKKGRVEKFNVSIGILENNLAGVTYYRSKIRDKGMFE